MSSVLSDKQIYGLWVQKHHNGLLDSRYANEIQSSWRDRPRVHIVLVLGFENETYLADFIAALCAQSYDQWKLTVFAEYPAPNPAFDELEPLEWIEIKDKLHCQVPVRQCVRQHKASWVLYITAPILPAPNCLLSFITYTHRHPSWKIIYSDSDQLQERVERTNPVFRPDFNLDLFYTTAYVDGFCLVERQLFEEYTRYGNAAEHVNASIVLDLIAQEKTHRIGHIADILCHYKDIPDAFRSALHSEIYLTQLTSHLCKQYGDSSLRLRLDDHRVSILFPRSRNPYVSIIVCSNNDFEGLIHCVSSIVGNTDYEGYEITVLSQGNIQAVIQKRIEKHCKSKNNTINLVFREHIVDLQGLNQVMLDCRGEFLVYLDARVRVKDKLWLDRLLRFGLREDIAVVAPFFIDSQQHIRSPGVVLGAGSDSLAEVVQPKKSTLHQSGQTFVKQTQNYSSVSPECFMLKKQVFSRIEGYHQKDLPLIYGNVDLCLRAITLGFRVVVDSDVIMPIETANSNPNGIHPLNENTVNLTSKYDGVEEIIERWLAKLGSDPFYNRNLSLMDQSSSCDVEMDVRWDNRIKVAPRVLGMSAGSEGSRMYRMTLPFLTMESAKLAQASLIPKYPDRVRVPTVAELERMCADTLVLHNTVHDAQLKAIAEYKRHNKIRMIFSQDDLMINIPKSNPFHKTVYKDIERRLVEGISYCDGLLVTTEPLAHAYSRYTRKVTMIPNYLQGSVWLKQKLKTRTDGKPRVGWAGAQQHGADIALLYRTIQATYKEVDWIFMGMCAKEFLPYVKEVHNPVSYDRYPQMLASLNLDLGLAPLEINPFNEAKSNLKLLEYGVLGIPVICTDIFPYQGGAPVTRVSNRSEDWTTNIREHISDRQALQEKGQQLRRWVERFYLLEDHLQEWSQLLFERPELRPEIQRHETKATILTTRSHDRGPN